MEQFEIALKMSQRGSQPVRDVGDEIAFEVSNGRKLLKGRLQVCCASASTACKGVIGVLKPEVYGGG